VGGLVGRISSANNSPLVITNCISNFNITATLGGLTNGTFELGFGGLIGKASGKPNADITIKNSGATGEIIASSQSNKQFCVGGLVAYCDTSDIILTIDNCYSKALISAERSVFPSVSNTPMVAVGSFMGRFTGNASSHINNCVALGGSLSMANSGTGTAGANRIVGVLTGSGTLSNNKANAAMTVNPEPTPDTFVENGLGGANISLSETSSIISTLNTGAPNTWTWDSTHNVPILVK
jgi:hypothetical protein